MTDQSVDFLASTVTKPVSAPVGTDTPQPTEVKSTSVEDLFREQLSSIRNEEGLQKYASVKDALSGAAHAQEFIRTLKNEKKALEEQLLATKSEMEKRMSVEDAMSKLAQPVDSYEETTHDSLGRDEIFSLMQEYESAKAAKANYSRVNEAILKYFGDEEKARSAVQTKMNELGIDAETLRTLASRSPSAAMRMLGLEGQAASQPVQKNNFGSINTEAHATMRNQEIPKSKGIMIGATTGDLVNEWRLSKAQALQAMGISE